MISIAKPALCQEEKDAVIRVMDSGMIASGAIVTEFENAFAMYIGTKYSIATCNGTTALEIALRAMGIGPGDKVVTTTYSFIASTNCIVYVGATPIFADIDINTFNIDIASARKALQENPDTKAILVVHLFGHPCDMDAFVTLAKEYNVMILEDCAQAHGAKWKGQSVGTFGDAAAFSFYPTKNITTGEGGMVLTNNETVAENSRYLINHGMKTRYFHERIGYNYRMTDIAAAIGLEQLKKLDNFIDARRKNASYYNTNIRNSFIEIPYEAEGALHCYHQYTIKIKKGRRASIIKLLEQKEIGYGIFYPHSIPEQPCYNKYNFRTKWPITDYVKTQALSIPVHPLLSQEEKNTIVDVIDSFSV